MNGRKAELGYPLRHDILGKLIFEEIVQDLIVNGDLFQLPEGIKSRDLEIVFKYISESSFGHHGVPVDGGKTISVNIRSLYNQDDEDAVKSYVKDCYSLLIGNKPLITKPVSREKRKDFMKFSWVIAGLAVFADWIASDIRLFNYCPQIFTIKKYWKEIALPQAEKALKETASIPSNISYETGIEAVFPFFKNSEISPSPLQVFASEESPGRGPHLYIIEESTGGGKTEAAVTLAHRLMADGFASGIYIGLPTMATANAMYDRISGCYRNLYEPGQEPSLILAHGASRHSEMFMKSLENSGGKSGYNFDEKPSEVICSRWLADNKKKALLAPVGIGTIDQALVAILPVRHQSLRLFGLFQNVLIVDEVHAYDSYMAQLLKILLAFLSGLGGSVILLSATLPLKMKEVFLQSFAEGAGYAHPKPLSTGYPLVTHLSADGFFETELPARKGTERSVAVELLDNEESLISRIISELEKGRCVCWIRNTVRDAVSTYQRFCSVIPEERLVLFHSRFIMGNRLDIEKEVVRKFGKGSEDEDRSGMLLIATQVVEQSLDIDFDCMVTDLAPVDLIIQRAGRLHRHVRKGRNEKPVLWIYSPEPVQDPNKDWYSSLLSSAAYVYPKHGDLYLTAKLLSKTGEIATPDDARDLIEGVYGEESQRTIPQQLKERDQKAEYERKRAEAMANLSGLSVRSGYCYEGSWKDDENPPTRLSEPTVTLLLGYYDEESGFIRPLYGEDKWDLSQVNVRKSAFPIKPQFNDNIQSAIEKTKETMSDHGEWSLLIPLDRTGGSIWTGRFQDSEGKVFDIIYSRKEGLMVSKP